MLVLGGLINHTYHSSHHHPTTVVHTKVIHTPEPVVTHTYVYEDSSEVVNHEASAEPVSRFLKDSEGRCFSISRNDDGQEQLKEVEQANCGDS